MRRRRVLDAYVESPNDVRTKLEGFFSILPVAEVVKWQTRTFEGRVAQAVRVQVPPSAPIYAPSPVRTREARSYHLARGYADQRAPSFPLNRTANPESLSEVCPASIHAVPGLFGSRHLEAVRRTLRASAS